MLISYRQQKTCTNNCNLIEPDEYVSTAHLYVLIHWEQKRKRRDPSSQIYVKESENQWDKNGKIIIVRGFSVRKRRKLIVLYGEQKRRVFWRYYLSITWGGRKPHESEKRLSCIPNILSQESPVSKKPRTSELDGKIVKQEERVWRMKATVVSMKKHL